jgi:hypothetical protein
MKQRLGRKLAKYIGGRSQAWVEWNARNKELNRYKADAR